MIWTHLLEDLPIHNYILLVKTVYYIKNEYGLLILEWQQQLYLKFGQKNQNIKKSWCKTKIWTAQSSIGWRYLHEWPYRKMKGLTWFINPICTRGGGSIWSPLSFFVITLFLKTQLSSNFQTLIWCFLHIF